MRALLALVPLVLLLAGGAARHTAAAGKGKPNADEMKEAINADYKFSLTNWDSAILNDTHANLKLEAVLWSAKPRKLAFTVFTQLTVDRLSALLEMCGTFSGPLSAAVFQAVVQQPGREGPRSDGELSEQSAAVVAEGLAKVQEAFKSTESSPSGCQLDVMYFYEVYDSTTSALLYPVNYLRNYARMQVRTRLMAMIDVDMLMSSSFSKEMEQPGRVKHYETLCAEKRATVLPAFEPTRPGKTGKDMARNITTMTKSELAAVHGRNKVAMQFKLRVFVRGHTPTDYKRLFETDEHYQVQYKRFYEPWFITCNEVMPWYDVDFRGYGMNKIILIASLNFYNYTFWVNPNAWLVHLPHPDTEVRSVVAEEASQVNKYKAKLGTNSLYRKLTLLFGKAKRAMMRGDYVPSTDPRMMAVYGRVPWLLPPPQLKGQPTPESVFV